MSFHTQDEISQKWDQLKNGDELDGSRIVADEELEQALAIVIPAHYHDSNGENAYVSYTRKRVVKNVPWGTWDEVTA
jgi:hypothetical protein